MQHGRQPAVFLDRDNTLIENHGDLGDPEKVTLKAHVPDGLKKLRDAGFRLVVVTNQAGVARNKFTEDDVDAVHQKIADLVDEASDEHNLIDRFYYCPYHPEAKAEEYRRDHPWRKPHPGMLLQAARDLDLDLSVSWMVGDQPRDIEAGRAAGCRTVLLSGEGATSIGATPTVTTARFDQAVSTILRLSTSSNGVAKQRPPENASRANGESLSAELGSLRRTLNDLSEEMRTDRQSRSEFTPVKMTAVGVLLGSLLLIVLGLLQLTDPQVYLKWMVGAMSGLLLTIALLLIDNHH